MNIGFHMRLNNSEIFFTRPNQSNEIILFLFSVVELLGQIAGCADGLMWWAGLFIVVGD